MTYDSSSIEVLTGLEPVRKRPGMYTQTERPNHLVLEVVDNSVDEAIAGHCTEIDVTLHADGSASVADDGRGMPVDVHPEEGVSGVEVILTRLHAGAKFGDKDYRFSGGLHGVGVSVVNALSARLEVWVRRDGNEYAMAFAGGEKRSELKVVGKVGQRNTGTAIHFWPDPQYFDSNKVSVPRLKHALCAKAVLCRRLRIRFVNESDPSDDEEWYYEDGLEDYLDQELADLERVPERPIVAHHQEADREVDWAVAWLADDGDPVAESYVNLIPTAQGGTHVNGFRTGLTEAVREFCEFRNLLPRGVTHHPRGRLGALLLHPVGAPHATRSSPGRPRSGWATATSPCSSPARSRTPSACGSISTPPTPPPSPSSPSTAPWRGRGRARRSSGRRCRPAPPCPASSPTAPARTSSAPSCSWSRATRPAARPSRPATARPRRSCRCGARSSTPGRSIRRRCWARQEVHDIAVALGVDPGSPRLEDLRYGKVCILADADSDGAHIATLLCALFVRHFRQLVAAGRVHLAMPPLYRIDVGKEVYYALDEGEKKARLEHLAVEKPRAKPNVQRFKGLGEMNPLQLRETVMAADTRRLVQLTLGDDGAADRTIDMLLARGRAADRRAWLEDKGNLAEV